MAKQLQAKSMVTEQLLKLFFRSHAELSKMSSAAFMQNCRHRPDSYGESWRMTAILIRRKNQAESVRSARLEWTSDGHHQEKGLSQQAINESQESEISRALYLLAFDSALGNGPVILQSGKIRRNYASVLRLVNRNS